MWRKVDGCISVSCVRPILTALLDGLTLGRGAWEIFQFLSFDTWREFKVITGDVREGLTRGLRWSLRREPGLCKFVENIQKGILHLIAPTHHGVQWGEAVSWSLNTPKCHMECAFGSRGTYAMPTGQYLLDLSHIWPADWLDRAFIVQPV